MSNGIHLGASSIFRQRRSAAEIVLLVLVPTDFVLLHPEGGESDCVGGAFVVLASLLGIGAPHNEGTGRDRNHLKSDCSAWNGLSIILERSGNCALGKILPRPSADSQAG